MPRAAFYLLTDSHYVSPRNWVEAPPINNRERGDQIALKATPEILDAFLEKILADDDVDTVVFTGDNVDSGDMNSHYEFRERLEKLTAAGKKVYVTTATHDYVNDGTDECVFRSANRYTETGTEPIPYMRKAELFDFYFDYGPKQALSVHRESGSYVVQLGEGVRLGMIEDNGNGRSHCGLFEDGMAWLREQIREAKKAGDEILLTVHHPVLPPWDVFEKVAAHELYGGYEDMKKLMCEEGVRVIFTGHTHVQSIRKYTDDAGRWFLNIATIALANAFGKMRFVTVDPEEKTCEVTSVGADAIAGTDAESLYARNFPGIVARLLPLGVSDYDALIRESEGFLSRDMLEKHRRLIVFGCKKLRAMKLAFIAKHGRVWRKLTDEQKRYAKDTLFETVLLTILRHIYTGNAPYGPETVENIAMTGLAARLDRLVHLFRIGAVENLIPPGSSLTEMAQGFLYNDRTGDDDSIRFSLQ